VLSRLQRSRLYEQLHRHEIVRQFVKYALVGCLNVTLSLAIFNALRAIHIHRLGASTIAFVVTSIIGFTLNKMWSFRDHRLEKAEVGRQYVVFVFFTAVGLALFTGAFRLLLIPLERFGRIGENAAFLGSVPVSVLWNFTAYRRWTFRPTARAARV
jgi:putative flippase GtrA